MKFIYIDDSYLRSSPFLDMMRMRLLRFCEREGVTHIFISGDGRQGTADVDDACASSFYELCRTLDLLVIQSPCSFEIGDHKGVLTHTSLLMDDQKPWMTYSGSAIYSDFDSLAWERIYFELFLKHEVEETFELIEDELMDLLQKTASLHTKMKRN